MNNIKQPLNEKTPVSARTDAEVIKNNSSLLKAELPENCSIKEAGLCSGFGRYHTDKLTAKNPKQYERLNLNAIITMLKTPQNVDKENAQWVIFSTLKSRDAQKQREEGIFYSLWADIDDANFKSLAPLVAAAKVFTDNAEFLVYTSKSATQENPKSRLIIPLNNSVNGKTFELLQVVLCDYLENAGVIPDRVTSRPNQICFLPNEGDYYDSYHNEGKLLNPGLWRSDIEEKNKALEQAKEILNQRKKVSIEKTQERLKSGIKSPIDAFNQSHDIGTLWEFYGATKKGERYISPLSQSGVAGIVIKENRWLSSHGSDKEAGIGVVSTDVCSGDAFDLFKFFECANDHKVAVKKVADLLDPEGQKQRQQNYMAESNEQKEETFPEPENLFKENNPLPNFPLELMPNIVGEYAREIEDIMGTDPAAFCMAALGIMSAAITDGLKIQPKVNDNSWRESARLWVGIIGSASTQKSPALKKAITPLRQIEKDIRNKYENERKKFERELAAHKEKKDKQEEPPELPHKPPRFEFGDVTVEAIADVLASTQQTRGTLLFSDELAGWLNSMNAYKKQGADKAHWLEFYDGGYRTIDRVTRGSLVIENWGGSILGGIQPSVIQNYKDTTLEDGLLPRFLLVNLKPKQQDKDKAFSIGIENRYSQMIKWMTELEADSSPVMLSPEAAKLRQCFSNDAQEKAKKYAKQQSTNLESFLGKWTGTFARVLLVYHIAECYEKRTYPNSVVVSEETTARVIKFFNEVILPHAEDFYSHHDRFTKWVNLLANLLLSKRPEGNRFTVKAYLGKNFSAHKTKTITPSELNHTLERLETANWIRPEKDSPRLREGWYKAYIINPHIYEKYKGIL